MMMQLNRQEVVTDAAFQPECSAAVPQKRPFETNEAAAANDKHAATRLHVHTYAKQQTHITSPLGGDSFPAAGSTRCRCSGNPKVLRPEAGSQRPTSHW